MSTTTAADLLDLAYTRTRDLRRSGIAPTKAQWDAFDDTVHRLVTNLLGPYGRNVPLRSDYRLPLLTTVQTYPDPLRDSGLAATRPSGAPKATSFRRIPQRPSRGHLHAVAGDEPSVPSMADLDLPMADDPDPFARLTCTMGALADLLVGAPQLDLSAECTDLVDTTARILSLTAVVARHSLSFGAFDQADRVLAVGRWAERRLDRLGPRGLTTAGMDRIGATYTDPISAAMNDRLEAARVDWTAAAQAEVNQLIPSVEVLRVIANQGAHLYGVTARVLRSHPSPAVDQETINRSLAKAAQALRDADEEWVGLSTLTRASHEFLSESRRVVGVLKEVGVLADSPDRVEFDHDRAVGDLVSLAGTMADIAVTTRDLPGRLLHSHLLFGNGERLLDPVQRLNRRTGLGAIPLGPTDAPDLQARWTEALLEATRAFHALDTVHRSGPRHALTLR